MLVRFVQARSNVLPQQKVTHRLRQFERSVDKEGTGDSTLTSPDSPGSRWLRVNGLQQTCPEPGTDSGNRPAALGPRLWTRTPAKVDLSRGNELDQGPKPLGLASYGISGTTGI